MTGVTAAGTTAAGVAPSVRPGLGCIWARSTSGVIGVDGGIPWRVPEDMAHFRDTTDGTTVVMGRRTWESIPARFRPFANRRNVVLTRDRSWSADGAEVLHTLDDALAVTGPTDPVWIVGGGEVYAAALPLAARVAETVVDVEVDGDTSAPTLGPEWATVADTGWRTSRAGQRYRITDRRRRD